MTNNKVSFLVYGSKAIFTDPLTKPGGERHTLPVPTYEALRGILESVYWKPTIRWVISRVRVMNPIIKETVSVRLPKYTSAETDRSYHTYLTDVAYQVEAYFVWSHIPGTESDQNVKKHLEIARRSIARGGRYDVYLGGRECQAYVESCVFGEGAGAYDHNPKVSFGLMYHGYTYPNMCGEPKLYVRFWDAYMENGVINFPAPEECEIVRFVRNMEPVPVQAVDLSTEEAAVFEDEVFSGISAPSVPAKIVPAQAGGDMRSWSAKLCETFDHLIASTQENEEAVPGLLYPGHIIKPAQFELTVDGEGNLAPGSIRRLPAEESYTIIPCSVTSQFRTGPKKDPHLLFDSLEYLAGDYSEYMQGAGTCYKEYMGQLREWCASEASHPFAEVIYAYLIKGTLMNDLDRAGVLPITKPRDGEARHLQWPKNAGSGMVRFRIQIDDLEPDIWNNHSLWQSACQFNTLRTADAPKDVCYVTGEYALPAPLHPYLRGTAKLISSNDKTDFTYRYGCRDLPQDYLQISYEASQKIHLALRWLLANQSFQVGDQTYLIWSTHNVSLPPVLTPDPNLSDRLHPSDITGGRYAEYVRHYMRGLIQELPPNDEVVLLCLASPSQGRIAITQYETLSSSGFLTNLKRWHESAVTRLPINGAMVFRAPTPQEVASVACAMARNTAEREMVMRAVLEAMILDRPLPRSLPEKMVRSLLVQFASGEAFRNAINPVHSVPLNITVGIVRKYLNDLSPTGSVICGAAWSLLLNKESLDRSYLLGRLLAFYYRLENLLQYISRSGYHLTDAERYMRTYYERPAYVLHLLEQKMQLHKHKLQRVPTGRKYLAELDSFRSGLDAAVICDKRLTESFVLGYHAQMSEFFVNDRGEHLNGESIAK